MATSGNYNFALTRDEIINTALRKIRVLKRGFTPAAEDISDASLALNGIVAQLREKSDGSPSLKMWTRERVVLFLADGQYKYELGPNGDHAALESDLVETTLTAGVSGTVLPVASATGIADGDFAGVVNSSGDITWTTVSGAPSGLNVTVAASVTANSGAQAFFYTTKPQNPVRVLQMNQRDSDNQDTPMGFMTMMEYRELGDKDAEGTPINAYVERRRTTKDFYFDQAANDVTYTIRLMVHYPIQSFDATSDNPDFPEQWFRCLYWMLALELAGEYDVQLSQQDMTVASSAILIASRSDPETTDLCFEPGRD